MSSHAAYPAVTGRGDLPATLSAAVLGDLLRGELGFTGVTVTDAIDMKALGQGAAQVVDAVVALQAGADLLLMTAEPGQRARVLVGLRQAVSRGMIGAEQLRAAAARIAELVATTTGPRPDLDVVGCGAHHVLAAELARRAVTLLRDPGGLLPLPTSSRVLAVQPAPFDRTPADTSSTVAPLLAAALARRCASVDAHVTDAEPSRGEIDAIVRAAADVDVVVVGLVDGHAHPQQVALVDALAASHGAVVTLSLRVPLDATLVPATTTHLCTYGVLAPSMHAVADALVGAAPISGRLPLSLGGHLRGSGLQVVA